MHLRLYTHHLHPVFLPGLCVFRLLLSLYNFAFLHMAGDRGEGPSGLPGSKSSVPTIREVSNQLKDLIEVVRTLVSDQRQMRERVEGIGAEVYQLQRGDCKNAKL